MNGAPADSAAAETPAPDHSNRSPGWSPIRWLWMIALVFAVHLTLIFLAGEKKPVVPRRVSNVPRLQIANAADPLLALNDPTLFARPGPDDFAMGSSLSLPGTTPLSFRWTERPRWLPLTSDDLGAVLVQFLETNYPSRHIFNFKPAPGFSTPALPVEPLLAQNSTMQLEGGLARRKLTAEISLTNWPYADVIAPSKVQVLVDAAGNVDSAILLPPNDGFTATDQYSAADQQALVIARNLRFAPASRLTIGRVIFNWHTVPPTPTSEKK